MSLKSMTGFGRQSGMVRDITVSIELSSVNRKNLEKSFSLPREWQVLERDLNSIIQERFDRGKIHVSLQATVSESQMGFTWDQAGMDASLERLRLLSERIGSPWPPDADTLVRLASLNKVDIVLPDPDECKSSILTLFGDAVNNLESMRSEEGTALGNDLFNRSEKLRNALHEIRQLANERVPTYREILFQRLNQSGLELDLSDERVLKEIAIFADKCDISEEITRLISHFEQFETCLKEGSPVGRKLEFILQEVNREFNTVGSKANQIEISRLVIDAKNEIERIREQIQNIE